MKADVVVTGRIASLAGAAGFGWVEAVAIADGRVVLAGSRRALEVEVTLARRRIELPPDRVAIPGLVDGHIHLADEALARDEVDLAGAASLAEGLERIRRAHLAASPGEWLTGHGWDPVRWGAWPTSAALATVAGGRPVALWSHDHHAAWASTEALAIVGLDASVADPPGGVIRRDPDGTPSGVLHEAAAALVFRSVPPPTGERLDVAIERACRSLLARGVVGVQDPGDLAADAQLERGFAAYARLASAGRLPIRVHASIRAEALELALARRLRSGDDLGGGGRARMGWLKLFADGSLGARTARLLEPYEHDTGAGEPPGGPFGVEVTPPAEIARLVRRAADGGIASQVHAIGDAAVRAALDALEQRNPGTGPGSARRPLPRVEHAQLVEAHDVPRFARSGIAACVEPRDLRADRDNAERFWGRSRTAAGAYAYGSLAASGAILLFGTDAPVEPADPWPAIAAAVTRADPSWPARRGAFNAAEGLSLSAALRAATLGAATATGEADRGRLVPGHAADLVVAGAEAFREPVVAGGPLESVRPDLVLVDGAVVHEAAS